MMIIMMGITMGVTKSLAMPICAHSHTGKTHTHTHTNHTETNTHASEKKATLFSA